ncbi:unnamed protein product [Amoebophrya sp. A25]|nr:unnamed protein product [Amoebophrya sp. A25]|eukprot:GSA25T00021590001.1
MAMQQMQEQEQKSSARKAAASGQNHASVGAASSSGASSSGSASSSSASRGGEQQSGDGPMPRGNDPGSIPVMSRNPSVSSNQTPGRRDQPEQARSNHQSGDSLARADDGRSSAPNRTPAAPQGRQGAPSSATDQRPLRDGTAPSRTPTNSAQEYTAEKRTPAQNEAAPEQREARRGPDKSSLSSQPGGAESSRSRATRPSHTESSVSGKSSPSDFGSAVTPTEFPGGNHGARSDSTAGTQHGGSSSSRATTSSGRSTGGTNTTAHPAAASDGQGGSRGNNRETSTSTVTASMDGLGGDGAPIARAPQQNKRLDPLRLSAIAQKNLIQEDPSREPWDPQDLKLQGFDQELNFSEVQPAHVVDRGGPLMATRLASDSRHKPIPSPELVSRGVKTMPRQMHMVNNLVAAGAAATPPLAGNRTQVPGSTGFGTPGAVSGKGGKQVPATSSNNPGTVDQQSRGLSRQPSTGSQVTGTNLAQDCDRPEKEASAHGGAASAAAGGSAESASSSIGRSQAGKQTDASPGLSPQQGRPSSAAPLGLAGGPASGAGGRTTGMRAPGGDAQHGSTVRGPDTERSEQQGASSGSTGMRKTNSSSSAITPGASRGESVVQPGASASQISSSGAPLSPQRRQASSAGGIRRLSTEVLQKCRSILSHVETSVKPISNNPCIETTTPPQVTNLALLPFKPLALEDVFVCSNQELEVFLTKVYKCIAQGSIETKIMTLIYLENLCGHMQVADLVVNSSLLKLVLKMVRVRSVELRMRLWTLIGQLLRHATFLEPSIVDLGIFEALTEAVKDKAVQRKAAAALGELLFYVATQPPTQPVADKAGVQQTAQPSRWRVPSSTLAEVIELILGQGGDEVVAHYAVKTLENISTQAPLVAQKWFLTSHGTALAEALHSYVVDDGRDENFRLTCLGALAMLARIAPGIAVKALTTKEPADIPAANGSGESNKQFDSGGSLSSTSVSVQGTPDSSGAVALSSTTLGDSSSSSKSSSASTSSSSRIDFSAVFAALSGPLAPRGISSAFHLLLALLLQKDLLQSVRGQDAQLEQITLHLLHLTAQTRGNSVFRGKAMLLLALLAFVDVHFLLLAFENHLGSYIEKTCARELGKDGAQPSSASGGQGNSAASMKDRYVTQCVHMTTLVLTNLMCTFLANLGSEMKRASLSTKNGNANSSLVQHYTRRLHLPSYFLSCAPLRGCALNSRTLPYLTLLVSLANLPQWRATTAHRATLLMCENVSAQVPVLLDCIAPTLQFLNAIAALLSAQSNEESMFLALRCFGDIAIALLNEDRNNPAKTGSQTGRTSKGSTGSGTSVTSKDSPASTSKDSASNSKDSSTSGSNKHDSSTLSSKDAKETEGYAEQLYQLLAQKFFPKVPVLIACADPVPTLAVRLLSCILDAEHVLSHPAGFQILAPAIRPVKETIVSVLAAQVTMSVHGANLACSLLRLKEVSPVQLAEVYIRICDLISSKTRSSRGDGAPLDAGHLDSLLCLLDVAARESNAEQAHAIKLAGIVMPLLAVVSTSNGPLGSSLLERLIRVCEQLAGLYSSNGTSTVVSTGSPPSSSKATANGSTSAQGSPVQVSARSVVFRGPCTKNAVRSLLHLAERTARVLPLARWVLDRSDAALAPELRQLLHNKMAQATPQPSSSSV